MFTIPGFDRHEAKEINKTLREMLHYFYDAERDSDEVYSVVFPKMVLKTNRRECQRAVKELYSWITDDEFHVLSWFHQYVLYWIIEFCIREEEAHNEAVMELGDQDCEPGLFAYPQNHWQEHDKVFDLVLPCLNGFNPTEINIMLLQGMFKANVRLNKAIIDQASSAVVPAKSAAGEPVEKLDAENDYIWFCFAKFTKTSIAIQKLYNVPVCQDTILELLR